MKSLALNSILFLLILSLPNPAQATCREPGDGPIFPIIKGNLILEIRLAATPFFSPMPTSSVLLESKAAA